MYLFFDTETTGVPDNTNAPISEREDWPRVVQLAYQLHDAHGKLLAHGSDIVRPEGFTIPYAAQKIHGISTEYASQVGKDIQEVLRAFEQVIERAHYLVGHNIVFDLRIVEAEWFRLDSPVRLENTDKPHLDTMLAYSEHMSKVLNHSVRWPKLGNLYKELFDEPMQSAHDARADIHATAKCFFEMYVQGMFQGAGIHNPAPVEEITYEAPDLSELDKAPLSAPKTTPKASAAAQTSKQTKPHQEIAFVHLYAHSQFSNTPSLLSPMELIDLAKQHGQHYVALCDIGNMHGIFHFVTQAHKEGLKPIVGCELFISEKAHQTKFTKDAPDKRYRQPLLAANKQGYAHLSTLCSLGHTTGLYGLYPRVSKEAIQAHNEGLIALSGGLEGELAHTLLNKGADAAKQVLQWWMSVFGDRFYLQINRHGCKEEAVVEEQLLEWAAQYKLRIIPTCEVFYANEEDADIHDTLLCIKANIKKDDTGYKSHIARGMVGQKNYYYRTADTVRELFSDLPESFDHLKALLDRIEPYELARDIQLPTCEVPQEYPDENAYLQHLTNTQAQVVYTDINEVIRSRLDNELEIIIQAGYAGYFLIVREIVTQARHMGVAVGPGRGSVGGSLVAYVLGITEIDPLQYGLLFERFLNPDRISMPDIDIDFDDEKRDELVQWIVDRYGAAQVAQITTYGTMAARSSIRDCARVLGLDLASADRLAKQVDSRPGALLEDSLRKGELHKIIQAANNEALEYRVLEQAQAIEGTLRNFGTHACGFIIAPKPLIELVPVARAKDTQLLVTQYDNEVVERAGLLKMDLLGLRTLSILRTTCAQIRSRHGVDLDLGKVALDDKKTYALLGKGNTVGIFQFESAGMQRYLTELKPDRFEDLIAMNALYRPGPMDYIREFIDRKHGKKPITYHLSAMEDILAETYGITVYQEQVMRLSMELAGFSLSQADILRYAMGKKDRKALEQLKPAFLEGFRNKGHTAKIGEKIWKDWQMFASYAFNKSHSTSYALLAYQTAYCKANYPSEYMCALLTHHQDQSKIAFLIDECRKLGTEVLPPCVNASQVSFSINAQGAIRYGLAAAKGVGKAVISSIINAREHTKEKPQVFQNLKDFCTRIPLRKLGKKALEGLAGIGALDVFKETHRKQYLEASADGDTLIDKLMKWSDQQDTNQAGLFGSHMEQDAFAQFCLDKGNEITPYTAQQQLEIEKELAGVWLSGHLLDKWRTLMHDVCNITLNEIAREDTLRGNRE